MADFRSDTVTQPTPKMKEFMFNAPLGDDIWGDDPSVNELEALGAEMFGKEAAVFCSSGTQTNQIAIKVHTQPGDEIICHEEAHIYRYEGGGIAYNSGVSVRFLRGNYGRINPDEIAAEINPDDQHHPITTMVSIEDTSNRGGGMVYDVNDIQRISEICKQHNLKFHLDGARVFNALAINGLTPKEYGAYFDTISVCLSKGLGAPVGSLLLGPADFIQKARRVRKVFGGAMRQAGIIASGGTYALKNHLDRLKDDHRRASQTAEILKEQNWVKEVLPVQTNIVVVLLQDGLDEYKVVEQLAKKDILCVPFGKKRIRLTTHLDLTDEDIEHLRNHVPKEMNA
ncbi:MAG: aminotransferase class I/II-fold pyridoxal phosphate-dependent enzyme [Flavobacteriales bacterium]|nr:aminotransferase class I/II-fold pyridoxal phosphate-dependent enzyme [Flavobacteriales bacterium]